MPKRNSEDADYCDLERKIRKLERKMKKRKRRSRRSRSRTRHRHRRSRSLSSRSSSRSPPRETLPRHGSDEPEGRGDEEDNSVIEVTHIDDEPIATISANSVTAAGTTAAAPVACSSTGTPAPASCSDTIVTPVNVDTVPELDDTILEILGVDPTQVHVFGAEIQKELAVRLEHYATNGLTKETRKQLKEQYLVPRNCKMIGAPVLNEELKAVLSEVMANRDKAIELKQTQLASAISALGQALTQLFTNKDKNAELIKTLIDTCRILCDCQYSDSMRRRGFVLTSLRKDIKDPLQSSTKIDNYLFGQGLAETLKATKAINRASTELKAVAPTPKPQTNKKVIPNSTRPLNWKGPFQTRRQPEPQRTKEPAPTKYRQANSSRPSQHRPQRNRRR